MNTDLDPVEAGTQCGEGVRSREEPGPQHRVTCSAGLEQIERLRRP